IARISRVRSGSASTGGTTRSEEHTSELQSLTNLVCRLLLEKKKDGQRTIAAATLTVQGCSTGRRLAVMMLANAHAAGLREPVSYLTRHRASPTYLWIERVVP